MTTSPSVPRRRLSRGERREQLLHAARQAFVQTGYHATAMDDIAEIAGVSKPVLYQHFTSKHELYLGLFDEQVDHLVTLIEQALSTTSDNGERVAGTITAYFDFVDRGDAGYRLLFSSDHLADPEVNDRLDQLLNRCAAPVARVIEEDTGLPAEQAHLIAVGLCGMSQAAAARWRAQGRPINAHRAAALLAQVAWRGVGTFPLARTESVGVGE